MNDLRRLLKPTNARLLKLQEAEDRLTAAGQRAGAQLIRVGESREGRPIQLVRFGRGEARSFWYAGPHANEVIGVSTIVELAERLADEPTILDGNVGFDLVLCIDPDGYIRNEDWFGPSIDLTAYFRGFFRPAMAEFPDWDFPLDYSSEAGSLHRPSQLPESQALRAALELSRPIALNALHNAELGGAHFCLAGTRETRGLAQQLSELISQFDMPRETAMLDDPSAVPLAPGVFPVPDLGSACEAVLGLEHPEPASLLPFGDSAASWCTRYGTISVIPEIPYWSRVEGDAPSGCTTSDLARETAEDLAEESGWLEGVLVSNADFLPEQDPRARSLRDGVNVMRRLGAGLSAWGGSDAASGAASFEDLSRFRDMLGTCFPQRYRGMLLTALEANGAPAHAVAEAESAFAAGQAKLLALELRPHPIRTLVDVQLTTGVLVTEAALA